MEEGWLKGEEWGGRMRDGWLRWCCGVSRGWSKRRGAGGRLEGREGGQGGGGGLSGWLVGDALRELPAARSRDSYPRPIIDRSPEKRRTHCAHQALYLAPYQLSYRHIFGGGDAAEGFQPFHQELPPAI